MGDVGEGVCVRRQALRCKVWGSGYPCEARICEGQGCSCQCQAPLWIAGWAGRLEQYQG